MSKRDREGSDWKRVPPVKGSGEDPNDVRQLDEGKLDRASNDGGNTALPRSVRKS